MVYAKIGNNMNNILVMQMYLALSYMDQKKLVKTIRTGSETKKLEEFCYAPQYIFS